MLTRTATFAARTAAAAGIAAEEFEEVVRAHQRRVYRVLLALVRDPDAAETLTQECFLRAYRNRKGFRGESSVGTWLVRIAVNLAADHGRSRRNAFWRRLFARPEPEDAASAQAAAVPDPRASPERQLAAREQLEAVWSAAEGFSSQQRAAFVLRFAEEMTLEEVARAMGLEVGTVKSHLARAVGALRKKFEERPGNVRTSDR